MDLAPTIAMNDRRPSKISRGELTKVLLTGGAGMVGRNILEHPRAAEWNILAPSRHDLDLTDYSQVEAYVQEHSPDIMIHTAGRVGGIRANVAEPVQFLVSNLDIGRNVVLAAREAGVRKLINLGSSCMYPREAANPLTEDLILCGQLEPTNEGYALAKIVTLRLCEYIHRENPDFEYKTLIPCNLYGKYDKFSPESSHLIPAIIHKIHQAIQAGHIPVDIWGAGTARREFMYSEDFADVAMQALEDFDTLPYLMNVGVGHDFTINEYYAAVAEVMGYKGEFVHDLTKPVGMEQKLVSIERQSAWGWQPHTDLHQGIEKTCTYYLKAYLREG